MKVKFVCKTDQFNRFKMVATFNNSRFPNLTLSRKYISLSKNISLGKLNSGNSFVNI